MSEIIENKIIEQIACYYDISLPKEEKNLPVLIALHGYGGSKKLMMRLMQKIINQDCMIVCLQAPYPHIIPPKDKDLPLMHGFGWLTNFEPEESIQLHHRLLVKLIDSLKEKYQINTDKIFLLGFSQSVALNFRFAFTSPNYINGVIGICGGIPGDWATENKYKNSNIDILYIAGEKDEFYSPSKMIENANLLRQRAKNVEFHSFDCGHQIPKDSHSLINQWLAKRIL